MNVDTSSAAYQMGHMIGYVIAIILMLGAPIAFIVGLVMLIRSKNKAWLFLMIPSGLLFLMMAGLFCFGVVVGIMNVRKIQGNSPPATGHSEVVKSTDSLIHLTIPGHWRTLEKLNEDAQLQAGNPAREEYLLVFNESKADFKGSLEDYAKIITGNLLKKLGDEATISEPEKLTINGHQALRYQLSGSLKMMNLDYFVTLYETPSDFHQVISWTLHSHKAAAFPIFQQVADSFALENNDTSSAKPKTE